MKPTATPLALVLVWTLTLGANWMQYESITADGSEGETVTGLYRTPEGEGPFPAVIMLPDCDGISPHERTWGVFLAEQGYAVHLIDSFFTRGIDTICSDPSRIAVLDDARGSLAKLRSLDEIDSERIYVMGWQSGGDVALDMAAQPDMGLAGVVVFYPSCSETPVLRYPALFVQPDEAADAAACSAYMSREYQAGRVAVQRIAPYGVGAGFDCESCGDGYLGDPRGYDQPSLELVQGVLVERMVVLTGDE
tara:strand:- start:7713 stop:8462 length:750 start_codon:yes stop_codon:yes gene_type:complete